DLADQRRDLLSGRWPSSRATASETWGRTRRSESVLSARDRRDHAARSRPTRARGRARLWRFVSNSCATLVRRPWSVTQMRTARISTLIDRRVYSRYYWRLAQEKSRPGR